MKGVQVWHPLKFIVLSASRYLCLNNKLTANSCFVSYTQQHPQVESGPPFVRPLLNFLWLLLLACDGSVVFTLCTWCWYFCDNWLVCFLGLFHRGTVAVFTILVEQYQPTLRRDPSYTEVSFLHLDVVSHPVLIIKKKAEKYIWTCFVFSIWIG